MKIMGRSHQILVVDDELVICRLLEDVLNTGGYDVLALTCPNMAAIYLEKHQPALLVLSAYMPGISGWNLASLARKRNQDLPVIFVINRLVAGNDRIDEPKTRFLYKPFKPTDLLLLTADLLED